MTKVGSTHLAYWRDESSTKDFLLPAQPISHMSCLPAKCITGFKKHTSLNRVSD